MTYKLFDSLPEIEAYFGGQRDAVKRYCNLGEGLTHALSEINQEKNLAIVIFQKREREIPCRKKVKGVA